MMSSEKKSAGPTSLQASIIASSREPPSGSRSMCLCAFSIITMAASTMAPIAIAMPPRLMMFEFMPSRRIAMNAISTPIGQHHDGHQRAAHVQQEHDAHRGHDDALLDAACA